MRQKRETFTQLICDEGCIRKVKMSKNENKNEKHFSRRLNIQVCELSQVLTAADIKMSF